MDFPVSNGTVPHVDKAGDEDEAESEVDEDAYDDEQDGEFRKRRDGLDDDGDGSLDDCIPDEE